MSGTVTGWLHDVRQGSQDAVTNLWDFFFPRLCRAVTPRVQALRISDEEDISLTAFNDLITTLQNEEHGKCPSDRTELWRLLCVIAARKAKDSRKYESAAKRGGSLRVFPIGYDVTSFVDRSADDPDVHLIVLDECNKLMNQLTSTELKQVAKLKIRGFKNSEIASEMSCSLRTIQYMIKQIRETWLTSVA